MIIVTEHAFTLDQLVALVHGDLDLASVPVVTHEISEEEAAIRAGKIEISDDDEDGEPQTFADFLREEIIGEYEDTCRITAEDLDQMLTLD